ncbi:MAG: LamG-like jellyroll fold domain-containing protein, partial [Woeseiaceae bacterium]
LLHLDGVKKDAYFRGASGGAITGTSGKHRALADAWTHVAIVSKLVDGVDAKGKPEKKVQVEIHSGPYITTNIQRYKEGSTTPILTVGAWDASPSYGFHGALDDLRIYARALSAGEISALAAVGNPRTDLGNVAEIQDLMETSNHAISAANTVTPGSGGGMAGAPDAQLSTPGGTPVVDSTNPLDLVAAQQPATSTPPQPGSVIEATGQPLAGIGDIDMAPDPDLQQTQDRVAEFDENARPADWRLTRIISVNPQPAIPGQDIKFRIEIEKDDPLNLAGEAYAGVPYSGQLSLVDIQTSTNDSAGSLQMEVVWTVPEDIIPQSSLGQSPISHTVIISLFGPQETKLGDRDPTNNRMETEVVVNPWDWTFRGVPGISGSPGEEVPLTLDLIKSDPGDLVPVVRVHVQGGDAFPVYKELGTEHLKTNLIVKIPKDAPYCGEGSVFRRELVLQAPDGAELVDQVMNNNRASIAVSVLNPEGVYSGSDGDACEFDADTLHYPDNGKLTKVSGYAATANYETINLFSQQRRLKGIGSAHGGGKLCLVSLVAPGPGGNSSGYAEGNVIDRCNGNEEDWDYGDLSFKENWAVTGIQVCHEDSGNRVKAIRAWGKELQPDGTLGASERAKTFTEIAGCADWKQRRDCPTNTVATGARFHFDDGTVERPVDYLKGIQLICTRLEP